MMLAAWVHNLNPVIFHFTDVFAVRWYGLAYLAGFAFAYFAWRWLARRGASRVPIERIGDAMLLLIMGVVVGGRVGYVLFYRPELAWTFGSAFPWWGMLAINEGGMASHGGVAGVMAAGYLIARGWKTESGERYGVCPWRHVMDLVAMLGPFGLFLGRIANFINGELLGKIVAMPGEPSPWWSVKFPQELLGDHAPKLTPGQEQQLVQALAPYGRPGDTNIDMAIDRLIHAIQHGSPEATRAVEPLLAARVPSQLIAAIGEGLIVFLVVWWVGRKPQWPGTAGCAFMITYGLVRIIDEIWRLPDAHLQMGRIVGMSRGQWLSVLMVIVGVGVLLWIRRTGGERMGGWMTSHAAAGPGKA